MPFKSDAQRRFAFGTKQSWAKRWAKETPNMKDLPEKVSPTLEKYRKRKKRG